MDFSLTSTPASPALPDFLSGGGEMGELIRTFDWSSTPLGHPAQWPQSLKTCVRILLTSRQPMFVWWGKGSLVNIYNDAYIPVLGAKHPKALGQNGSEIWREIWAQIGPRVETVLEKNEGTYDDALLLVMNRYGYDEETYFKFSYNPVPGDNGGTEGLFCACVEETDRIISERQLKTLTRLGTSLTDGQSVEEVIKKLMDTLQENPWDFPFALFRTIRGTKALLAGSTQLGASAHLVPAEVPLQEDSVMAKSLTKALTCGQPVVVENIIQNVGHLPSGSWPTPPRKALVFPIALTGIKEPKGVLVIGLNPYRLLDETYANFFRLVADQVATSLTNVQAYEEERKRVAALAELDRAKTAFFSNISHEFRTPLTLLLGPMEEVLQHPGATQLHETLQVAYRNALRMQKLVNTLLDFSRMEAGRMQGRFAPVDLCAFTRDLAGTFRAAIEKASMQLDFTCEKINGEVYVDADMWEKIVLNLLSNAFKYTHEGSIGVAVRQRGEQAQLTVTDTGVGIPGDQLDKIFDRFHRIENTRGRSGEGTGIGLALVKELVHLHGGTIRVESKPGNGSVFTVSLPLGTTHLPADRIVTAAASAISPSAGAFVQEALKWLPGEAQTISESEDAAPATPTTDKPVVLLADDNADMRDYLHRLLSARFNVVIAVNGEEAFQKAVTHSPEAVLSDIMMPVLDGYGLLHKLRQHPAAKNIPVIFLSARAGEEAKVEGLEAGADDYLVKPFSAKELLARVEANVKLSRVRQMAENNLRNVLLQAPVAMALLRGENLVMELANDRALEMWGKRIDEVLHKPVLEGFPELMAQGFQEIFDGVMNTGTSFTAREMPVTLIRHGEPETLYVTFIFEPLRQTDGTVEGLIAVGYDVSDQVKARNNVEQSRKELSDLANAMPQLVWEADAEGNVVYYNERVAEFTGAFQQPDGRWQWQGMLHPDDREATEKAWQQAVSSGTVYEAEHRVHMKDSSYRWHLSRGLPQRAEDGTVAKWFGTATDIDEQKKAAQKIQESEEQLRIAIEGGELGMYNYNLQTGSFVWSAKTKEHFGLPHDAEVSFETFHQGLHPDDRERSERALQQTLKPENGGQYENEYRTVGIQDGKVRWIRSKGRVFFDKNGVPLQITGVNQDITRQKELLASLQLQSMVLERMDEGVSISDENGIILYTNPAEDKMFGYGAGELIGQHVTVQNAYSSEENSRIVNKVIQQLKQQGYWSGEWHNRKKDGRPFFTNSYITSVESDGKTRFVCVQRDITKEKETAETLRFRKALLEAQNEAIPDAILIVDTKGNMLSYNRHFVELWQIPEEIAARKDDAAALRYAMTQLVDPQGFLSRVNYCYEHPEEAAHEDVLFTDGRIIDRYGNAVVGEDGTAYGWAWYFRDVTAERKAADALAYQKQLLETVTENTSQALFLMDARQHCIYMNEAAEEMTGFTLPEVQGRQLHYFVHHTHPDGRPYPLEECPIDQALPAHKRMQGEEVFVRRDGSFYPVAFTASPILLDGQGIGTVIEVRDTTEEKKKENELKESEQRLSIAIEAGELGTWDIDLLTDTTVRSLRHDQIFGYTEQVSHWGMKEFFGHIHPEDQEKAQQAFENAFTAGKVYFEVRIITIQGALRWIVAQGKVLYDDNGKAVRMLGVVMDVTGQKLLEKELENKVRERTKELNQVNAALQRSNEDLQQFAHVASHDLKEPLRKIRTFASRLAQDPGTQFSGAAKTFISKVDSAADRMAVMIEGVLNYSMINATDQKTEPVDLRDVMDNIAADLEVLIQQKEATLHYDRLPMVDGAPVLLHQLFYNLVNNSLKFSKPGVPPQVTITSSREQKGEEVVAAITIEDNGIGFEQEYAERIFNTFARLNSKDAYEGTGLGLSLCKKIVERHGGTITATGKKGEGAVFCVRLPYRQQ